MFAFLGNETGEGVDATIVTGLISMLDKTCAMAKAFRMARNWCHTHNSVNFELHLLSERITYARQYNTSTVSEVAALIINDFGDDITTRDIVVDSKDGGPKWISELHSSYMDLQYPLLFPYGEDGFHEKIPYHNNAGARKTKRGFVSMKEYYAYIIQQRSNQANTLLRGGRLYQQFLVDAYTARRYTRRRTWEMNSFTKELYRKTEFQKRGLPHAHILLWLEEEWKCRTPTQIDDIIFAEIPCLTDDPKGYKVLIEFMLQGPCGKGAACTEFIISLAKSHIEEIVKENFPDFTTKKNDEAYLKERAILTPQNDDADAINAYMFIKFPGPTVTINSADEVCKASTNTLDQQDL
ncbi:ATP-dependent DNA helicase PIF1-like protein [Tanacetum coccineum]